MSAGIDDLMSSDSGISSDATLANLVVIVALYTMKIKDAFQIHHR